MKLIVSVFSNLFTDQRVEKVCDTLVNAGYSLSLIGNDWQGLPEIHRDYPVKRLRLSNRVLRYAYVEWQWKLYRELLRTADAETVLMANDLDTLLPNYLVAKKLNIPLVFDSHEIFTEMPALQGRFTQKIWRSLESFLVPKLRYMITANESYATWFRKTYDIPLPAVVRNYPRALPSPVVAPRQNGSKVIIYQGVINPFRGLDKLISAMRLIDAELWIAGEGPKKSEYELLVKAHGLESKIKFLGKLSPANLRGITQVADVGVSIEENGGLSYYLSLPNKISDYVQARIPIVVSDFPEMRKIVDSFGVGEKINNYSELPEKICRILNNGKKHYAPALELAAAALCWEHEAATLLAFFQKVQTENF